MIRAKRLCAWLIGGATLFLMTPGWTQGQTKSSGKGTKSQKLRTVSTKTKKSLVPSTAPPAGSAGIALSALNSKERNKKVQDVKKAYKVFRRAARQYLGEVRALVQKRYRERRKLIAGGYDSKIDSLEKLENLKRKKAIQYFLAFVQKYPNHPEYSPDAMYRLAELYYEEEYTQYLAQMKRYDQDLQRYDNKQITEEPITPKKQFVNTVIWLTRLTQRFRNYRYTGNAYYLLGYCKGEEGKDQEAIRNFAIIPTLTNPRPTKKLIAEAWVRLGEFYFRTGKRDKAKAAYQKVLNYPKLAIYDKALYKLAWTHYLSDEFELSIQRFTKLLDFYIERKKKGKQGGNDLRKEAIQYIGISFADEQWGSIEKAFAYVQKVGPDKPYVRDVLLQLANYYGTQNKWEQVLAVNNKILALYPNHPDAPLVMERNIRVARERGKPDVAVQLRRKLGRTFGVGSPWHKANATNIRAQRQVRKILSKSVYRTAIFHHASCNVLRKRASGESDPSKKKEYLDSAMRNCVIAAENYREFLSKFPHHKKAYELTWYLADSLYFSKKYKESIQYFKKVRDWPGEKEYRQDAAFSLIDSIAQTVNNECRAKRIARACELPESKKKEKNTKVSKKKKKQQLRRIKVKPLPIPELQKSLLAARGYFLKSVKQTDKRVPEQLYLAARIYFAYDHLSEARKRLWKFVRTYPKNEYANFAATTLLSSYYREGNLDKVVESIDDFTRLGIHIKGKGGIKTGIAFIKAKQLEKQGKFAASAKAYVNIINKNPNHKEAAPALWNAALLYTRVQRYGSALRLYKRIVERYPTWRLADKALFRLADNAEKYFQFRKAVQYYLKLVDDRRFRKSKQRANALYNAALLLENLQRYPEAARAFRRYSIMFREKSPDDAAKRLYQAATVYKRAKRTDDMIRILKEFIRRYSRNSKQVRLVMMAHGEIMKARQKQNLSPRKIRKEYQVVIDAFTRLSNAMKPVDIDLTKRYPAEAAYRIVMEDYEKFLNLPVDSKNAKKQGKQILKKIKEYDNVAKKFGGIVQYQSAPWLLCAMFRIAEGKQKIAEAIQKAPVPPAVKRLGEDAVDQYKDAIDQKFIQPLENDALKKFRAVISNSQRLHYQNECTAKTFEALNKADPRVPLPKKTKHLIRFAPLAPLPLIRSLEVKKKTKKNDKTSKALKEPTPRRRTSTDKPPAARK